MTIMTERTDKHGYTVDERTPGVRDEQAAAAQVLLDLLTSPLNLPSAIWILSDVGGSSLPMLEGQIGRDGYGPDRSIQKDAAAELTALSRWAKAMNVPVEEREWSDGSTTTYAIQFVREGVRVRVWTSVGEADGGQA